LVREINTKLDGENLKRSFVLIVLLTLLVMAIAISRMQIKPVFGSAKPYYIVDPQTISMGPEPALNKNFTISIKLCNATVENVPAGVQGVEVHLTWNNSLIEPVSFTNMIGQTGGVLNPSILYGIDPGFYDEAGNKITNPPYTSAKYYKVAAASTGSPWNGIEGVIATITFKVIYQPEWWYHKKECSLAFYFTDLVDSNVVGVDHDKINGHYEIIGLNPSPMPIIKLDPQTVSMGPEPALNKTFTVAVKMLNVTSTGLPPPNGIYGIEIWLEWNATLIKPISYKNYVGNGTVGVLNSPVFFVYDNLTDSGYKVAATSLPPAEPWNGNGTIVEITFQVMFQKVQPYPDLSCAINITFSDVQMLPDDKFFAIFVPHVIESGKYEIHQFPRVNHYTVTVEQNFIVTIESDSIIFAPNNLGIDLDAKTITFNVTTTDGYCNVTIPKSLMTGPWIVYVDGSPTTFNSLETDTNTYLWFEFSEGYHVILIKATWIIPEFPSVTPLLASFTFTLTLLIAKRLRHEKRHTKQLSSSGNTSTS
jgi:hypothetical protein